ncbi:MAG TPA: nucleoside 2-deoxyribosyltransferase [Hyphomicrobiaceae bacterium]|jgi:nucleoside 2-deoxyribosyltransferase|nr:nucleoside 2-deoxyribosyltransferase [Hyphomicrobiaceae bacterium]
MQTAIGEPRQRRDGAMSRSARPPRIYLAGPEVFLPSARALGGEKCRLLAAAGLEGVFPYDASLAREGLGKRAQAERIFAANTALMRSCAGLIANLTPFRGVSADAGTIFEVGFMRGLGRPVSAYTNVAANYHARATAFRARRSTLADCDRPECAVEDHDLSDNLMLEMAVIASGCSLIRHQGTADMAELTAFRGCLADIARLLAS